ncbi:hypothetical protein ACE193_04745 [Bernardetia sp. OM2101]|uniref:hypothetical protein n=1 Tax=Bernardetia sp. OM2101 TaxID=3344876 RepID=UPI0035CFF6E3
MKYSNSMKSNKFVSKFAYIFLALFAFLTFACESNNDDNPLVSSTIKGYVSDTNYWFTNTPSVLSSGKDSLGRDTILNVTGASLIDGSTISMFVPFPAVGSFTVAQPDSINTSVTTIKYNGEAVPSGTINITRFDTVRYILEAEFNFSFEGVVEGDSGTIDTTSIEFTKGEIRAAYLRRR